MVLLENVRIEALKLDEFPRFKCLCELCDDGCFDRRKQKHHPDCRRQFDKASKSVRIASDANPCLSSISHYKDTFKAKLNARPATTCHPPADAHYSIPRGAMDFNTSNKNDFKSYGLRERTRSMKKIDKYEKSEEKISGTTSYGSQFFAKELNRSTSSLVKKNPNEITLKLTAGPISNNTTNKEHFKQWPMMPKLERGYSEYPSLVGISLFPSDQRQFSTSTAEFHHKFEVTPRKPIKSSQPEFSGSLKIEGDMNLNTNYRDTFVKYQDPEKTRPILPKSMLAYEGDRPFLGKSQTSLDFVRHMDHHPPKIGDRNMFASNLSDQLYPGPKTDHTTLYSTEFKYDPVKVEKTKTCKKAEKVYEVPIEKIESETVTKRDFRPIDVKNIPVLKAKKIETSLKLNPGPMETKSMSMLQFVPYEVKPVILAKDPHPDYYSPIKAKFENSTTTKDAFKGEQGEKSVAVRPKGENLRIEHDNLMKFDTHYRETFIEHGLSMCQSKAYLIAQSMTKHNDTKPNPSENMVMAAE